MPTYVYRCSACGHQFEKFHKISAKTRPRCPKCGKAAERTITGGAGLLFKGSGFYITDYKKGGPSQGDEERKGQEGREGQKEQKEQKEQKRDKPAAKKAGDEH